MTSNLKKVTNFLLTNVNKSHNDGDCADNNKPEIGFKIAYSPNDRQLKVKLLSARNLPSCYGNNKSKGYLTKLTLFPFKEKHETKIVKETNPIFNEEYTFSLDKCKRDEEVFKGKFIVLTVYAVLDTDKDRGRQLRRTNSLRDRFRNLLNFNDDIMTNNNNNSNNSNRNNGGSGVRSRPRSLNTISFNNRRNIGAVTYNLENKYFTLKLKNNCYSTPDIWRNIQSISTGTQKDPKESKNGTMELTMTYSNSEDGNNESIMISLTKFRCSMSTMQYHETVGGNLYLKLTVWEKDRLISKWKSDKFEPTISMKIESSTATLSAIFKKIYLNDIKIILRLICKNLIGKKTVLGKIVINKDIDLWYKIIDSPSVPITETLQFDL